MKTIYKYQLPLMQYTSVRLPHGAEVISIQDQGGMLQLWALVHTDNTETQDRHFVILGTGFQCGNYELGPFIATVQQGGYVWHIFEAGA